MVISQLTVEIKAVMETKTDTDLLHNNTTKINTAETKAAMEIKVKLGNKSIFYFKHFDLPK